MQHEDAAVCRTFDSTRGTHRLDLKFHASWRRQNLSRDPRSLRKTLHLVNAIAQASSAWRPKENDLISFVANDDMMSIMRADPLHGEDATLWMEVVVGGRCRLLISHLLVFWCDFSPCFQFRLTPERSL